MQRDIDELIGCRCEEPVHSVEMTYHVDDGVGSILSKLQCTGCGRRVDIVSRIVKVYDVNTVRIERPMPITDNDYKE